MEQPDSINGNCISRLRWISYNLAGYCGPISLALRVSVELFCFREIRSRDHASASYVSINLALGGLI